MSDWRIPLSVVDYEAFGTRPHTANLDGVPGAEQKRQAPFDRNAVCDSRFSGEEFERLAAPAAKIRVPVAKTAAGQKAAAD